MSSIPFTRREFIAAAAGAWCSAAIGAQALAGADQPAGSFGLASNALDMLRAAQTASGKKPTIADPLEFLKECKRLGAGGGQTPLGIRDDSYCNQVRQFVEQNGMYLEASLPLPADSAGVERFEKQLITARAMGATIARTVAFAGRRYEVFSSPGEFAAASKRAMESLQRAEPVARKYQIRLAIENHKDQRIPERLDMLKRLGSEYLGICVDVGNSFALCEDPIEVVKAYAPLGLTAHIKDQAVREYDDGFLFADAAMGQGFLDLPAIVSVLRKANPRIRFNIEVMTRDPLRVPVFTSKYWSSMPDVPAADLARTMQTVKSHASHDPLMQVRGLDSQQRVKLENHNITGSLQYARQALDI